MGRFFGRRVLASSFARRYFTPRRQLRVRAYFRKFGSKVVLVGRFTPGLRFTIFFTAGTLHLRPSVFLIYDFSAAAFSVPVLVYSAWFFGGQIDRVGPYARQTEHGILVAMVVGLAVVVRAYRRHKRRMELVQAAQVEADPPSDVASRDVSAADQGRPLTARFGQGALRARPPASDGPASTRSWLSIWARTAVSVSVANQIAQRLLGAARARQAQRDHRVEPYLRIRVIEQRRHRFDRARPALPAQRHRRLAQQDVVDRIARRALANQEILEEIARGRRPHVGQRLHGARPRGRWRRPIVGDLREPGSGARAQIGNLSRGQPACGLLQAGLDFSARRGSGGGGARRRGDRDQPGGPYQRERATMSGGNLHR